MSQQVASKPHGGVPPAPEGAAPLVTPRVALHQTGGDGNVTQTKDGGGRLLTNCRIVLIFWGNAWNDPSTNPSRGDFTNACRQIIEGPWATQLYQYRKIGPCSFEMATTFTGYEPATSFTDPQIRDMINGCIDAGALPQPDGSIDRLYCVIMPTGHSSGDTSFVGQHQWYDRSGTRVYWAWVTNDGTLTGGNSVPKVFSHELCEALSDPDLGSGITLTTANEGDEIGDTCNSTFSTINGVCEEAYWSQADGRCVLPVFTPFTATRGNPALVQGRFGSKGNFELVSPLANGALAHFWRNNDNPYMPWSGAIPFGAGLGLVDALTMIESNFGSPGNLELVARVADELQFFWRDSGPAFNWFGPYAMTGGTDGNPSLVQGRFGNQGNFELVVPSRDSGLIHYWRNNDASGYPWSGPTYFGQNLGHVDSVTVIQSNFGSPGNLEVICRVGARLQFFWRDSGPAFQWNGPYGITDDAVAGNPALVQSRFGNKGNFELVVPLAAGGLGHYWRNNDNSSYPWSGATPFGQGLGPVGGTTLIQSNYGNPGNLELVVQVGSQLHFFWRDSGPAFNWNGPYLLLSTTW